MLNAFEDCTAKLWSASSVECLRTLEGHTGGVTSAVFSASFSLLLLMRAIVLFRATGVSVFKTKMHIIILQFR